ncbi:BamA/TamA family outer membrane protein [Ferrimonas aestuarii]|uniref:Bacterial surface antigen (D15) domain-containing protein n=1 Tax=Ferrimonas aestuarii TaxID=2569539 RepID=A0A4U1BR30_9GAMM|nr:BamA/TamA family outer membrane protein [Ferrimonas aestuarii]TKB55471.1 hypothetical protein FCL42_09810 [Ferrimonas aestuarii]
MRVLYFSASMLMAVGSVAQTAVTEPEAVLSVSDAKAGLLAIDDEIDKLQQQLASSQLDNASEASLKHQIDKKEQARKAYIKEQGLGEFSLLGGPAYTPEMGTLVAIGGLYSFSLERQNQDLQRSNVAAFLVANKADAEMGVALRGAYNFFFHNDEVRLVGTFGVGKQTEHFWGVGFEAGEAQDSGDSTRLNPFSANLKNILGFKVAEDLYVGPILHLNYFDAGEDELPATAVDPNFEAFKDKPMAVGIGVGVQYDSRDVAVNAREGQFFKVELLGYRSTWGSDSDFDSANVEHRYYHSLAPGRVIATLNQIQWTDGDVPFYAMPELGGMRSMRGLYQGRFRDQAAAEHTAEYRHSFRLKDGSLSKHGMTVWGGIGSVAEDPSGLYDHLLYSYGIGYRYEIQPRMNLRMDLGISEYENGFYFNFTEAF